MTKRTTRWLLCLVLVVALVASLSLVACDQAATATFVGGDGATGNAPEPITANVGEKIHLPSNTFTYANHNFAGWSDGTTVYQAGAEYTLVADVTFTAQWTQAGSTVTKYSLKFALGEHAAEGATVPATKQLAEGATYTLPAGPEAEEGWIFEVWIDNNGDYAPAGSQKQMPAGDVTYTAQYTEDGSGEDEPFTTEPFDGAIVDLEQGYAVIFTTESSGDYFTLFISELGDSDSLGLAGEYRYAIEEGEITVFQNEELVGAGSIEGTLVYIALEVGDDAVEITGEMAEIIIVGGPEEEELFYLNVGAPIYWLVAARSSSNEVESATFNDEPLDLTVEEAAMAAGEGYTEVTEEGGILELTFAEEEQGYTLSFDLGDHHASDAQPIDPVNLKENGTYTLPAAPKAEDGWEFVCWQDLDAHQSYVEYQIFTMPNHSVTLTAQWSEVPDDTVQLTFDLGDHAAQGEKVPDPIKGTMFDEVQLPAAPKAEDGWIFVGWSDGHNTYEANSQFQLPFTSTKLTAQWKEVKEVIVNGINVELLYVYIPYFDDNEFLGAMFIGNEAMITISDEGGSQLFVLQFYYSNDDDTGATIIEDLNTSVGELKNGEITMYTTQSELRLIFTANDQPYDLTIDLYKLAIEDSVEGPMGEMYLNEDCQLAGIFEEYGEITALEVNGQPQDPSWLSDAGMPAENTHIKITIGKEKVTFDFAKYVGDYVSETPFEVNGAKIVKISVTESGITYYEEGDQYGTPVTPEVVDDSPSTVSWSVNSVTVKAQFDFNSVTLSAEGIEGVYFSKYEEPLFDLGAYEGEWVIEGSVEIGPNFYDAFKIENKDGKITVTLRIADGEYASATTNSPKLSVVDGKNVATFTIGVGWEVTITFESLTEAKLSAVDTYNEETPEVSGTFTKQGGGSEASSPFTTSPFNASLAGQGEYELLSLSANGTGYVAVAEGAGYANFTYTIASDGTINVVISEGEGVTFVSGSLHGRTLSFTFNYKFVSSVTPYSFEGELVKITISNTDNNGSNYEAYFCAGAVIYPKDVIGKDVVGATLKEMQVNGVAISAEQQSEYTVPAEDTVIVCVWESGSVSTSFTVTYQPGESATGSEYVDEVDSADYSFLTPYNDNTKYSRAGYHFKGWKIEGDESGTLYQGGNAYTLTQSIVVTAQWEKNFAISFEGITGAGMETNFDPENENFATSSTSRYFLPTETLKIPHEQYAVYCRRSGYTLKGWTSSDDDGTDNAGKVYAPGSEYTLTKDVTFTAQWEKAITSDHFAEYFGTYIPDETFQIQSGKDVSKIVVKANSIEIYDDSDGVVTADDVVYNEDNITFVIGLISIKITFEGNTMTLNFKWGQETTATLTKQEEEVVDKHKVTYECGEHGAELDLPQAEQYAEGAQVTVGYGLGNVEEGGLHYEFTGWSDGSHTYAPGDTFDMGSEDVTLTAQWAEYTPTDKTLNDYLGTWEGEAFTERNITKITIRSDEDVTYVTSDYPDSETKLSNITVNAEGKYFVLTAEKTEYGHWTLVITFTADDTATMTIDDVSAEFKRTSTLEPAQPKPDKPEDADGIYVNAAGTKALDEQIDGEYASGSYDFTRVELNGDSINLISTSPINDIALTWNHNEATGRYYSIYKFTVVATEGQLEITFNYGQQDFKATFTKAQMVSVTATFEKGEDDGVMGEPPVAITQQVVEGDQASVKMPDAGTLSREGFTFDGWQIKGDPEKHVYKKGETVKISGDQTFVPVWKENTAGGDSELPSTFSELAGRSFGFESAEAAGDNTITFTERIVIYKAEFVWYKPFGGSYAWYLQCYYSTTKTQYKLSDVVEGTAIDTEDAAYTAVNFTVSGNKWKVELTAEDGVLSLSITSSESVTTTWAEIVA